ncbi:hypothetical protein NDU88_001762 [Pleurodeles waltl]|uniref:Uncharacterized protein n=1 Tax=Pleurodeles waltl TaxID=8319 RepID=A0AAV7MNL6_PLEWA|nr:hypothetical protein NDU88_001762 [Pleurodeles waltl]
MCHGGSLGLRGPSDSSSACATACAVTCFRAPRPSLWLGIISRPEVRPHFPLNRPVCLEVPAPSTNPLIPSSDPQRVLTSIVVPGLGSAFLSLASRGSVTATSSTVHYGRCSTPGPTGS